MLRACDNLHELVVLRHLAGLSPPGISERLGRARVGPRTAPPRPERSSGGAGGPRGRAHNACGLKQAPDKSFGIGLEHLEAFHAVRGQGAFRDGATLGPPTVNGA